MHENDYKNNNNNSKYKGSQALLLKHANDNNNNFKYKIKQYYYTKNVINEMEIAIILNEYNKDSSERKASFVIIT